MIEYNETVDVLFRKGNMSQSDKGYFHYKTLINEAKLFYISFPCKAANRHEDKASVTKSSVSEQIYVEIKKLGGKFLKQEDSGLKTELTDKEACKKISQALREGQTKLKMNQLGQDQAFMIERDDTDRLNARWNELLVRKRYVDLCKDI
jgi:hypothetical protein